MHEATCEGLMKIILVLHSMIKESSFAFQLSRSGLALNPNINTNFNNFFFQHKIPMAFPQSNFGRGPPLPFNPLNTIWPVQQSLAGNPTAKNAFPILNNQLRYPRIRPPQHPPLTPQNTSCNLKSKREHFRACNFGLTLDIKTLQEGILKSSRENKSKYIDLISDDEQQVQVQKVSQEKSTNYCKINENNTLPNLAEKADEKQMEKIEAKELQKQVKKKKEKPALKTKKTKQITKQVIITKNKKPQDQELRKNRQIFSQRIVKMKDLKKQSFRLSKRERSLLQVNFLRDRNPLIMTGPQYQANLPKMITQHQDRRNWLKTLKSDLLARLQKQQ